MYLGLDVGGTHTDAVLLDEGGVKAAFKTVTDHDDLLGSINKAFGEVIKDIDPKKIKRINLSTTLSTNAIVEKKTEKVGVFVSSGPGVNPENYSIGDNFYILEGSIDHRGTVISDISDNEMVDYAKICKSDGIKVFAPVTKFSTRNPDGEKKMGQAVESFSDFTTYGHQLSGQLSFPRRIATAYYNSAVWRIFNEFTDAILDSIKNLGIDASINILKADGGTIPLEHSRSYPVESILSGPAASIMGIISLCHITEDSIILDIGGTTTDIAIFASGAPLVEREGITLESYPTLVRSLKTRSIGVGGDSCISIQDGEIRVGPHRKGAAMADGGANPTLIDALNAKSIIEYGDVNNSKKGIDSLASEHGLTAEALIDGIIDYALNAIEGAVEEMIHEINDKPVYTIHEMLEGTTIDPKKIYVMGGPARAFTKLLSERFGFKVELPQNYEVANAIGSALAKTTLEIELFADTGKGNLIIPNLNIKETVGPNYSLQEAESEARGYLKNHLKDFDTVVDDSDIEIVESQSFNMVEGWSSSGKDIRVKCQIKPGLIMDLKNI